MARFFSVPVKSSSEVDFKTPLRKYIEMQYGTSCANTIIPELDKLNNLRRCVVVGLKNISDQSVQSLSEYHDSVYFLESRVPMTENGVKIDFKWTDTYGKTRKVCSSEFERANVLFCIAAVHSQIAERCDTRDEAALKQAVVSLKASAGIFDYLASHPSMFASNVKDASIELLQAYSRTMLAQAQECVYLKIASADVKPALKAQIASCVKEAYEEGLRICNSPSIRHVIPTDWMGIMKDKCTVYGVFAQFNQAKVCVDERLYGESVARYAAAYEMAKTASSRWAKTSVPVDQFKAARDNAVKDNDFIYHASVPSCKELGPISTAGAISKTEVTFPILGNDFKDPFVMLVPLPVMEAKNMTEAQLKGLLTVELQRLAEASDALNAVMASLNLPGAIQTSSSDKLPDDLLAKIKEIQKRDGVSALRVSVFSLPSSAERNREILQQQLSVLKEEEDNDDKLRRQFGDRWTRQPSSKLNATWRQDADKMLAFLTQTEKTDASLLQRYQSDEENFDLLALSPDELAEKVKAGRTGASPSSNDSARKALATVCSQVETLKVDRGSLTDQLNGFTLSDDCIAKLSQLHQQHGKISPQAVLDLLNVELESVREAVRASEGEQNRLLAELQSRSEAFFGSPAAGGSSHDLLVCLPGYVERFKKLEEDVREGMKFYAEMTDRCIKGQEKIDDFCMARNTEKTEAIADITSNLSKVSMGEAPQVPRTTTNNQANQPPRPPATYNKPTAPPVPQLTPVNSTPAMAATPAVPNPTPGMPAGVYGGVPPTGWMPPVYGYGNPMPPLPPGPPSFDPSYAYPPPYGAMPGAYPMPPYGFYPGGGYMPMPGAAYNMPGAMQPPPPHLQQQQFPQQYHDPSRPANQPPQQ